MVTGFVNMDLEGIVSLPVQDDRGLWHNIDVTVDSAFTRWLTLPAAAIRTLGLPWHRNVRLTLADGTVASFDVYDVTVLWDGQPRTIEVDESEVEPLVGTRMMAGYQLRMDFVVGGMVEIDRIPLASCLCTFRT